MTNEQRKQALELLYFDPLVAFLPPNTSSWEPDLWLCESCDEYSPQFDFGKIRLGSELGSKLLIWSYEADPRPVKINASTGEVITGNAGLNEFHEYLKTELDKHAELAAKLRGSNDND